MLWTGESYQKARVWGWIVNQKYHPQGNAKKELGEESLEAEKELLATPTA